jgi:hypothetical protein
MKHTIIFAFFFFCSRVMASQETPLASIEALSSIVGIEISKPWHEGQSEEQSIPSYGSGCSILRPGLIFTVAHKLCN